VTLGIAGITSAYILIALLLLSINLYSNWSWQVKAGTIIITTAFYVITFMSFPPLLGWPTNSTLPGQFRLIAAHVQQPDKQTGDKGAVFLWLTEIEDMTAASQPRAYELPYSDGLHELIIHAKAKLDKGMAQLGEFEESSGMPVEIEYGSRTVQVPLNIQFYDLPDPLFPDK
jgi:hypothetical protein